MDVINVTCGGCGHAMRFAADKAGRKAKCPKCASVVPIPTGTEITSAAPPVVAAAEAPPAVTAASSVPTSDDIGAYGVTEAEQKQVEEEPKKKKKDEKKKLPKLQRKVKALADGDSWEKVRLGLLFVFLGTCLWAIAHLLQGVYLLLGTVDYPEYARLIGGELITRRQMMPEGGGFWDINQLNLLLGMTAGPSFATFAKICLITGIVLTIFQLLLNGVGYGFCLAVPRRFGTYGQVVAMLVLAVLSLLLVIFLKLLPALGAYGWLPVMLLTPEIDLTEYNMDRCLPLTVLWSGSAFWELILTLTVHMVYFLEPAIGCVFLWSVGKFVKDSRVEEGGHSLSHLALGQMFILFSYLLLSVTGSTPILVYVLRVVYCLWYFFLALFILRYAALIMKSREVLEDKIHPAAVAE